MSLYYVSIIIVIASNIFYHLFQKSIPDTVNPLASLTVTYAAALTASFLLLLISDSKSGHIFESFKNINWASFGLGLSIIGLEFGFLLAYRSGWNISLAALTANVIVSVLLIPVGLFLFNEQLSVKNMLGIILSILGIVLIALK